MKNALLAMMISMCLCGSQYVTAEASPKSDVIVIAHPDVPIDTLSTVGLRAIFGMRQRTWQQGEAIKVYVLPDNNSVHNRFAKQVLQTFPYNLRRIWDRRVYSGTGQSPHAVGSQEEMRKAISSTENAIGYISREWLNGDVKVVELN